MILTFFDTETTGLPNFKSSIGHPQQPRIVQFAFITTDDKGNEVTHGNFIVQTDVEIPKQAYDVHGIDKEKSELYGIRQSTLGNIIRNIYQISDVLIAHNFNFDDFLCKSHLARFSVNIEAKNSYCTVEHAKEIVKCPPTPRMIKAGFGNQYKNPNLTECYQHFFGKDFDNAHDALADVKACKDVYFAIQKHLMTKEVFSK